jgi:hypothetical protein
MRINIFILTISHTSTIPSAEADDQNLDST